jgi:electron transfer flavoprotein alpha subunit|tara:strand:- start:1957 stop:2940 length:984 start_codon:yes stop_codon:yes gene_type:complete
MPGNDVIIACESGDGQTESGNARLIATGSELARHWGGKLVCLLAGGATDEKADEISCHVDEVRVADFGGHPYNSTAHLRAARALVGEVDPRAVLFAHTFIGMDLAPRIAAGLGVIAASNCLALMPEDDGLYLIRPMYRGRIHAKVEMKDCPIVVTVQPGGGDLPSATRQGSIRTLPVEPDANPKVRPIRILAPVKTGIDIAKAEIIVAGGRGIGEQENFALVENLAGALGGVPACSRPLVDMGWFETDRQVGMSGNSVKPKLYVACGISGAVEHLHGMRESETIVAINKDPDAPIFEVAHFGIVGDVMEFMPPLIARAKAIRGALSG